MCKSGYSGTHCEKGGCSKPGIYDLGLIIDGSGSVGNSGFVQTKLFLLRLIDQFHISFQTTHFGIIVYSDRANLICRFSDQNYYGSKMLLKWTILGLEFPDGDTRTDRALRMAGRNLYSNIGGDRDGVPNVLVVITDGITTHGSEPYKDVLEPLQDREVNIIAVGIGNHVSRDELIEIAMGRKERVIQVDKIQHFHASYLRDAIHKIC